VNEAYALLDAAVAAARWGWLLSVFLLLGAGSYAPFLFNARTRLEATDPDLASMLPRRAARIGFIASLALIALTALRFYLQARSLQDPGEPVTIEFVGAVLDTDWGTGCSRCSPSGRRRPTHDSAGWWRPRREADSVSRPA
jgi:hypothetical protein